MAKTKSTLNNKLPGVSRIRFAAAVNSTTDSTKIKTTTGTWSYKVRFKQSSKKYPYQIQYRTKKFYTAAIAKTKGDSTKWSAWKNIKTDATQSDSPVNKWLKANVGVNKKSTFQVAKVFTNQKIASDYYKALIQVRIRTFNKAKATHGAWTTETLTVTKIDSLSNIKLHKGVNGGAYLDFDMPANASGSIVFNSMEDRSNGEVRELLTQQNLKRGITKRTNTHGYATIPASKLKRELVQGEDSLVFKFSFVTDDGIKTTYTHYNVDDTESSLSPTISLSYDDTTGTIGITSAALSGAFESGCTVSYKYHGKDYTQTYDYKEGDIYYFTPPLGLDLTFKATALDNNFNYSAAQKTYKINKSGYIFNSLSLDDQVTAVGWGEPGLTVSSDAQITTEHPYGRKEDVAFFGEGTTTNIQFTAKIIDKDDQVGGVNASRYGWERFRQNPGVYRFRTNRGDSYIVAVSNVQVALEKYNIFSVSCTMTEVSYG